MSLGYQYTTVPVILFKQLKSKLLLVTMKTKCVTIPLLYLITEILQRTEMREMQPEVQAIDIFGHSSIFNKF